MGFLGIIAQMFDQSFSGNKRLPFFVKETASSFLTETRQPRKISKDCTLTKRNDGTAAQVSSF